MIELKDIYFMLSAIADEMSKIRELMEKDRFDRSMILQKASNENTYTRLQ